MVFTTEGFLEVAIESWPEWDLNPRPLNSVQIYICIYIYIHIYIHIYIYIYRVTNSKIWMHISGFLVDKYKKLLYLKRHESF